jgi:hypothetical protein
MKICQENLNLVNIKLQHKDLSMFTMFSIDKEEEIIS